MADGTPRDCASPNCGAEADTSIIRDDELGSDKASALGRTEGGGPVDAASRIALFMGTSNSTTTSTSTTSTDKKRSLASLASLLGGGDSSSTTDDAATSSGTATSPGTTESAVAATAGNGATSGLPTCSDDGTVTMTFHQV